MHLKINQNFKDNIDFIKSSIHNFKSTGKLFGDGKRNSIKLFELNGKTINIKSFKIPNLINKIAYKYFRKSKARRSFEYATILLEKGIGTPEPIAYLENYNWIGLKDSYYASEHLDCDLTYRELVEIPNFPDHENILRQFTQFSFQLHQSGVEFLDHSPGNTLIKKSFEGFYEFFLVDLNRMTFHDQMNFDQRMKNLSRLTPKKGMIATMSNEYSKLYTAKTESEIFEKMWFYTQEFQDKFSRKQRLKKKLKFWKS
ncbi:Kdo domain containing protein [Flavobacterium praedii]|uniref:Kdo domain containing protein n=1 Tax=Flavobacterium praedii TaxID=3002900 RepID=UPI002481D24B|nr:Kdo domain containing protein [Flavobacterium praedii]